MSDTTELLHDHLERFRKVTLILLDQLAPHVTWRPDEGRRSVGEEFAHIAETEEFYVIGLSERRWTRRQPRETAWGRNDLHEALASSRERTTSFLKSLDDTDLVSVPLVPGIPVKWQLQGWLWYLVEHEIHHKAVLTTHARSLGVEVPFFAFPLPLGVRPDRDPPGPPPLPSPQR